MPPCAVAEARRQRPIIPAGRRQTRRNVAPPRAVFFGQARKTPGRAGRGTAAPRRHALAAKSDDRARGVAPKGLPSLVPGSRRANVDAKRRRWLADWESGTLSPRRDLRPVFVRQDVAFPRRRACRARKLVETIGDEVFSARSARWRVQARGYAAVSVCLATAPGVLQNHPALSKLGRSRPGCSRAKPSAKIAATRSAALRELSRAGLLNASRS